jgi:hypothetical protein
MLLCIFAANRHRVASRINFRLQAEPASFPRLSARTAKLCGVARLAACRSVWIVKAFNFDAETLLAARPKSRRNSAAGRDRSKNFFAHCRLGDALAMNYSGLMPKGADGGFLFVVPGFAFAAARRRRVLDAEKER